MLVANLPFASSTHAMSVPVVEIIFAVKRTYFISWKYRFDSLEDYTRALSNHNDIMPAIVLLARLELALSDFGSSPTYITESSRSQQ